MKMMVIPTADEFENIFYPLLYQIRNSTPMAFIPLLAFFLLSFSFISLILKRNSTKYNLPPGPTNLPLIGNLHRLGSLPHRSLRKFSQRHGPLMYLRLGTIPTVVASSPRIAKEIMKTHDAECCNRPLLTSLAKLSYDFSDIAFSPYGEQWRELRKICMLQIFSPKKVAQFRLMREEEVERMVRSIHSKIADSSKELINIREEALYLSNNVAFRSALGKTYYSEDPGDKGRLHELLDETLAPMGAFFVRDYVPLLGWMDVVTGMRGRLEKNFRAMDEFYQEVIEEHRDPVRRKDDRLNEDAVDALLDIQLKDASLTDKHIKGIIMNIFAAGSDTSATVIEWVMVELVRHPETMRKAQDEVRAHAGSKGKVEESDLDQLNYLKLVVKETLRLHPPGPLLLQRETIQHFKIDGYDIPAKSKVIINAWAIGRNQDVWERPEEFDPDRFIDSPINFMGHDFELIPFGSGRRVCPGMQSGILVVELVLANLLYCFNWELPRGISIEDIGTEEAPGLTVHPMSSLLLMATKY